MHALLAPFAWERSRERPAASSQKNVLRANHDGERSTIGQVFARPILALLRARGTTSVISGSQGRTKVDCLFGPPALLMAGGK